MYKREFDQLLRDKKIPKSVMLYGENEFYIDQSIKQLTSLISQERSVYKLYYDEYNFKSAKEYLSQSSLFGDINILLVRSDKKIPKKELSTLVQLASNNQNNYFFYIYEKNDFRNLITAFNPKQNAQHVRFFAPNMSEAVSIIKERADHIGLQMDGYATQHLLTLLNLNLSLAFNELEKLSLLPQPVGAKDIDEHVFSLAPMAIDNFLFALFTKKPISELISLMYQVETDEFGILRSMQYFMTQLFLFHSYIKLHGSADPKAILGYNLPRQLSDQRAALAVKMSLPLFESIFDTLAAGEKEMKTVAPSQKETLLLSILIKIKSFLG